ncbi:DUF4190 domain-containing protein [Microbacterium sp. NPDC056003]|uniref:DUF4190 domain-containing protein n=1 Tax=Microbacterium sp. NPDC056003 TaxID=3345676 RepID=UPI0035E062DD
MDPTIILFILIALALVAIVLSALKLRLPATILAAVVIAASLGFGLFIWIGSRGTAVVGTVIAAGGVTLGILAIALAWRSKEKAPVVDSGAPLSTLAIVGFILSFVVAVAGLIVSYLGIKDTRANQKRGYGLAVAGVIIGWVSILTTIWLLPVLSQWLLYSAGILRW